MKKLKTLCAIVGAAAMLYAANPVFAAEQKFNVPDYNLEGITASVSYSAITPFGLMPINDPNEAGEFPVLTITKHLVDRNKDGKNDLVQVEMNVPEIKYDENNKQPGYVVKQLFIDDDFNGYVERMLTDQQDEQGKPGADGIFDDEQYALRIQDV